MARPRKGNVPPAKGAEATCNTTNSTSEDSEEEEIVRRDPEMEQVVHDIETKKERAREFSDLPKMITTVKQFPSWHPFKKKLHIELYKKFQKSAKQVFPEPMYNSKVHVGQQMCQVFSIFSTRLDIEMTYPFLEFFVACLYWDDGEQYESLYAQHWEALITIPLFYLQQLITSLSACVMVLRTCSSTAKPKMFREDFKTKHLIHLGYIKPPENKIGFSGHTKQFMEEITELVKSAFENFTDDKTASIKPCLQNGNAFFCFHIIKAQLNVY